MMALLLARLGIARWGFVLALCVAIAAGALVYRSHVYGAGVAAESARRDAIDRTNNAAAERELEVLNAQVADANTVLNIKQVEIKKLQKDLDNEKAISSQRQADLLAGRAHDRVLVHATCTPAQGAEAKQASGAGATNVDQGASIEADLDSGVASWLEGVRAEHNGAVERLNACIQSYDAVKAASDAQ